MVLFLFPVEYPSSVIQAHSAHCGVKSDDDEELKSLDEIINSSSQALSLRLSDDCDENTIGEKLYFLSKLLIVINVDI